jgi:hypothetical protein
MRYRSLKLIRANVVHISHAMGPQLTAFSHHDSSHCAGQKPRKPLRKQAKTGKPPQKPKIAGKNRGIFMHGRIGRTNPAESLMQVAP